MTTDTIPSGDCFMHLDAKGEFFRDPRTRTGWAYRCDWKGRTGPCVWQVSPHRTDLLSYIEGRLRGGDHMIVQDGTVTTVPGSPTTT